MAGTRIHFFIAGPQFLNWTTGVPPVSVKKANVTLFTQTTIQKIIWGEVVCAPEVTPVEHDGMNLDKIDDVDAGEGK